jgi:hypothetical protein
MSASWAAAFVGNAVPHQRVSPAAIRSQRRFDSARRVARYLARRAGSARVKERVFDSDQIVTVASTVSTSWRSAGEMWVSCSSEPIATSCSASPSTWTLVNGCAPTASSAA